MNETSLLTHLQDQAGEMLERIATNVDVTKTLTCLISNLVVLCNHRSCRMADVRFDTVSIQDRKLKAKIYFGTRGRFEPPLHEKEYGWMRRKNILINRRMRENPAFVRFFGSVINALEIYSRSKGRRYEAVRVARAIIDRSDNLVMELNF